MRVREIMTEDPVCCTPNDSIKRAAELLADNDCGELPVVDSRRRPVGVITDRDICCRAVAAGKDPTMTKVNECMSQPVVTVTPDTDLDECCRKLEENRVRRMPVVDASGSCCGMIAQADIAENAADKAAEVVRAVSRPSGPPTEAAYQ